MVALVLPIPAPRPLALAAATRKLFYWNQNRAALHVDPLARRLSVGWVSLRYAWLVAGAPFASLCCDWSAGSVPTVDSSFFLLHGMKMSTNCPESTRDTSLERGLRRQRD